MWPEGAIGRIDVVEGRNATFNGQPAVVGTYIRSGDHVATGPASTLVVHFRQGGFLQLDENTDPTIEEQLDKAAAGVCTIVRVVFGRVFISGTNICLHDSNFSGLMGSQIALATRQGESYLVVIAGHLMVRTPVAVTLQRHQGLTVSQGGFAQVRDLSQAEVDESVRWRSKFNTYSPPDYQTSQPSYHSPAYQQPSSSGSESSPHVDQPKRPIYRVSPPGYQSPAAQPSSPVVLPKSTGAEQPSTSTSEPSPHAVQPKSSIYRVQPPVAQPSSPVVLPKSTGAEGWCCANRNTFRSTPAECRRLAGGFYPERRDAEAACQPIK